ncbi:hypothetical protein D1872_178380 [compost metagenome]
MREVLIDVEIKGIIIKNVPHVKRDLEVVGSEYTIKASIEAKLSDIYEYMKTRGIKEFDYNQPR